MKTLYPHVFKGSEFNLGPLILQFFIAKMQILINIMLKDDFCKKLNFQKIKFLQNKYCQ